VSEAIKGKVVLVTGAARRVGRAIAVELGRAGALVAVHYRGSAEEAEKTAAECGGTAFQADLSSVSEIERLFAAVADSYGRLDALVNNAAVYERTPILTTTEEQWDRILTTNLKAYYFCAQQAARLMLPRGEGRILNISSLGGIRPWAEYGPYNASKAGVIHMTKSLAKELAPAIQVNSIAPGVIEFADAVPNEVQRQINATPSGRAGTGQDIAEAALYLLTCSRYVTGQVLAVDGGLSSYTGLGGPSFGQS
jgi:NAD(P)-dependent dehydrogenase (short-subunit alcohol dehydrogenase family)